MIVALADGLSEPADGDLAAEFAVSQSVIWCEQWLRDWLRMNKLAAGVSFEAAWLAGIHELCDLLSVEMERRFPQAQRLGGPPSSWSSRAYRGMKFPGPSTTLILALLAEIDGCIVTRWMSVGDSGIGRTGPEGTITMFTSRDQDNLLTKGHPDALPFNVLPIETGIDVAPVGSAIFLASDGFTGYALAPQVLNMTASRIHHGTSKELIDYTNEAAGSDDATVLVVRLDESVIAGTGNV